MNHFENKRCTTCDDRQKCNKCCCHPYNGHFSSVIKCKCTPHHAHNNQPQHPHEPHPHDYNNPHPHEDRNRSVYNHCNVCYVEKNHHKKGYHYPIIPIKKKCCS